MCRSMTNITKNMVFKVDDVLKVEQVSYRSIMRHLRQLKDGQLLYDKYRPYKAGRQWRFELLEAAA